MTSAHRQIAMPILIGDIGGTNARFAIVTDTDSAAIEFPVVQTRNFDTIDAAIAATVLKTSPIQPQSAIIAIAGPVDGDEIKLTNCPWVVRPRTMISALGMSDVLVLNDFEAQALAVVALGSDHMEKIGGGEAVKDAARLVLGPGTGLGVAGAVNLSGGRGPGRRGGGGMEIA